MGVPTVVDNTLTKAIRASLTPSRASVNRRTKLRCLSPRNDELGFICFLLSGPGGSGLGFASDTANTAAKAFRQAD